MNRQKTNTAFREFVKNLPDNSRKEFRALLNVSSSQFSNWMKGNSQIPISLYPHINHQAIVVLTNHLHKFSIKIRTPRNFNLFKMSNELTTIKKEREARGLTQEELAAKIGIAQSSLSSIEQKAFIKTKHSPKWQIVKSIADFFEKPVSAFVEFQ